MRAIKFRAWDRKHNFMIDAEDFDHRANQTFIAGDGRIFDIYESFSYQGLDVSYTDVSDQYTLMQYTGLHDKNGVEIYEGDIIHCNYSGFQKYNAEVKIGEYEQDGSGNEYSPSNCYGVYAEIIDKYKEDEDGYKEYNAYEFTRSLFDFHEIEIIGNIYQHPYLLGGSE